MMTEQQYKREVAYRITSDTMKELVVIPRDEEDKYAPQYFALPDGTKVNRVFVVGTLLSVEDVGTDTPFYKIRVSDLKGIFNATIGMYSPPCALTAIEDMEPPMLVAIVGKIKFNEYEEKIFFNIAAESITEVDENTRDRYDAETEAQTHARKEEDDVSK